MHQNQKTKWHIALIIGSIDPKNAPINIRRYLRIGHIHVVIYDSRSRNVSPRPPSNIHREKIHLVSEPIGVGTNWRDVVQVDYLSLQNYRSRDFFSLSKRFWGFKIGSRAEKFSHFANFRIFMEIPVFVRAPSNSPLSYDVLAWACLCEMSRRRRLKNTSFRKVSAD